MINTAFRAQKKCAEINSYKVSEKKKDLNLAGFHYQDQIQKEPLEIETPQFFI